jgi:hypothetical protein
LFGAPPTISHIIYIRNIVSMSNLLMLKFLGRVFCLQANNFDFSILKCPREEVYDWSLKSENRPHFHPFLPGGKERGDLLDPHPGGKVMTSLYL